LFLVVDETKPHISEIEEIENIWSNIVGKLGEQKFEDYLRYFWNSEKKSVGKKNLFKTIKQSIKNKEEVFKLIRNLDDTSDMYLAIQNPEDSYWRDKPEIKKSLKALKLFQIRQTYSLFLSALKSLDNEDLKKLIKACTVISFRYNIIGGLNPNTQEEVYNNVALKILSYKTFDFKDFQSIYVSDSSFENDFSSKEFRNTSRNHKIIKYILSKIELYKYRNEIDSESDTFTIEHILPESADESWGEFSFEEINRSVYRIGNLTLLETKLNWEAQQKTYTEKIKFFEQSNCELTKSLTEKYLTWNEDKLVSRQKELAKAAKGIWKIQELN
jgi:hypothetical protein